MRIEELATIALDPFLGTPLGPEHRDRLPEWRPGRRWRVEFAFRAPAVPLHALALGDEVRSVWRFEVLREEVRDREDAVVVRVSPERRGGAGYHFIAVYRKRDLVLLEAKRYQGEVERPFDLRKLPPLEVGVVKADPEKRFLERTLRTLPPAQQETPVAAAGEDEDESLARAAYAEAEAPPPSPHPEELGGAEEVA